MALLDDGTVLAIRAAGNVWNGCTNCVEDSHGRVYNWDDTLETWIQLCANINGETSDKYSGTSVVLLNDGTVVAVGAAWNNSASSNVGYVWVYVWNDGNAG